MVTHKQRELLAFIHKRLQRDGVPPSFDEMKEALGLRSKSGIHRLITALEERGYIQRLPHRARAIEILRLPEGLAPTTGAGFTPTVIAGDRVTPPPMSQPVETAGALDLPVMGRIAAGTPIEAISHASRNVTVPGTMLTSNARHYALEVKGDSMINAGINNGDVVIIREQTTADNGDIVVALVEGQEATLKYLRRKNGMIALEAANPAYETRVFPDDKVQVQGRLVGLIRNY